MQIWDKEVKNGHIKRITDNDIQSSVLEIMSTNISTTFISCPANAKETLGIKLPFLVMIIKNVRARGARAARRLAAHCAPRTVSLPARRSPRGARARAARRGRLRLSQLPAGAAGGRPARSRALLVLRRARAQLKKYFTFEVTVLDDKNVRRRFRASNYQSTTRVKPFICTMPMRLDEGWNQIQFNLSDFTRRAYGTNYIETLRVQIHANCRIRRIYFSDRLYSEEELPPEFKLFLPIQVRPSAHGSARHPRPVAHARRPPLPRARAPAVRRSKPEVSRRRGRGDALVAWCACTPSAALRLVRAMVSARR